MNRYVIEYRIDTLSDLWDKTFTHNGFELRQWDFTFENRSSENAWVARKIFEAKNVNDAVTECWSQLTRLVDRIAFLSQCYTSVEVVSFLVVRETDNPNREFFINVTRKEEGVPLTFGDNEVEGLQSLEKYDEKGDAFRFLREAANASSYYTRLVMLLSALEAIAGEKTGKRTIETNKDYIRDEILKDTDLYQKIFQYGEGIRNRLLHGGKVDLFGAEHRDIDYVGQIYGAIVRYFNEKHKTKIDINVVNPLRRPYGNYAVLRLWLKPRQADYRFELQTAVLKVKEQYDSNGSGVGGSVPENFELLEGMPQGY